ncbi:DUF6226 family protein [Nocardioides sp. zg-1228]|uniref:DUF6226 family protein n=1 Tax=Nocardioides sp. zg-1228 TaxID=2763008 RepID=UPI001642F3D5|nr:DUF6226 family protein [Nocardioides sp. zg-1228]MBC2934139.1 VOC family protein [Nocardioides sp. zg-1228]QSF58886.1 VOC family protein [Nocardioides sp. zg-1228]
MEARFDHLVIAVADLDEAAQRWRAAGIRAERGGAHPGGTENLLVRGPRPAYVELVAPGRHATGPWLDRLRASRGPIAWAIAVDDLDDARRALLAAGFAPDPPMPGSRRTPDGELIEWRVCEVDGGSDEGFLPFLIEWTSPMGPGPGDGPVVEHLQLTPPDPDRLADLLLALGLHADRHFPRRVFLEPGGTHISLLPLGRPERSEGVVWAIVGTDDGRGELAELSLALPVEASTRLTLDGVVVTTRPDRRRFAAAALLPAVDEVFARLRGDLADWPDPHPQGAPADEEEYSRCLDPGKYRLLAVRADAWVEAIVSAGLGVAEQVDPRSVRWGAPVLESSRVTVVRGRAGTQPVVVGVAPSPGATEAFVAIGVGDPAEVLVSQPDCGCDACDTGSADLLERVDDAFVLALSGGVYAVRDGERVVRRSLDGWGSSGVDDGERWLADAAQGRRRDGVVAGAAWL